MTPRSASAARAAPADMPAAAAAELSPAQKAALLAIDSNRCAWRVRGGWAPKGGGTRIQRPTAIALMRAGLAFIPAHCAKVQRLELTGTGEAAAAALRDEIKRRKS